MKIRIKTSEPSRADAALLDALRNEHPGLSRKQLKKAFLAKAVRPSVKTSDLLPPGEHVFEIEDAFLVIDREARAAAECFLPVIHEDSALLVLCKHSGVPSVPHRADETQTAVGAALAHDPALSAVGRRGLEPGILHRLDTGTSGLIVFAKTDEAFSRLRRDWEEWRVRKIYRALARERAGGAAGYSAGGLSHTAGATLDWPIGHDAKSAKRMIVCKDPRDFKRLRGEPLPALTRILDVRQISDGFNDFTLEIESGVMHQIRAHLATTGWPIQGDSVYGGTPSRRLWLHAWKLEFTHPLTEKTIALEAPLPDGWAS